MMHVDKTVAMNRNTVIEMDIWWSGADAPPRIFNYLSSRK
jgi:hypothetical protein